METSPRKSVSKKTKSKNKLKKPIKVVYISNPMKVKVPPSEFRALVQELTGQDSELPDPTRFDDDLNQKAPSAMEMVDRQVPTVGPPRREDPKMDELFPLQPFDDDVFTPQMIEGGFLHHFPFEFLS